MSDLHLPHIRDLPRVLPGLFAEAARRAREAGFDGVELHYAHAYTMASFLSRMNRRTDGYGGARPERARLPLEVLHTVRNRVGADYVVGIRYLGHDVVAGGNDVDDATWFGLRFAEGRADYLSVSKGGRFEDARQPKVGEAVYPYTGESGHECMPTVVSDARGPFGRNVPLAAAIRAGLRAAGHAGARWSRAAACPPSTRRRASSRAGRPTSWRPRARPSPIRTGSGRSGWATGAWSAAASSRTTARDWTSGTSR